MIEKWIGMSNSKIISLIVGFFILAAFPLALSSYWLTIVTQMLIFGLLAMSLDILMGYTGLPSFGHAAFFGVSAYGVGILSTRLQLAFSACAIWGFLLSVAVAAIFGLLVAHTNGVYFLMITIALGMVIWGLAYRWVSMTGGENGISGIPRPNLGSLISLEDPVSFYYFVLIVFTFILFILYIFTRSPFGQSLLGIRESESRMRFLGYNTWLHKYISYVVAGAFSGISGILWAYYNGFVSPEDVESIASTEAFLMVILGGPGTLIGPAIGAGIIVFVKNFVSGYTHRWLMIMGTIYILAILFAPDGIMKLKIPVVRVQKLLMIFRKKEREL